MKHKKHKSKRNHKTLILNVMNTRLIINTLNKLNTVHVILVKNRSASASQITLHHNDTIVSRTG